MKFTLDCFFELSKSLEGIVDTKEDIANLVDKLIDNSKPILGKGAPEGEGALIEK